MAYKPTNSIQIDSKINPPINGPRIELTDLPRLVQPIIEAMHDDKPDVAIAGDRGGRLMSIVALLSWRQRYPNQRFPTRSGGIQFARVTGRSAPQHQVQQAVTFTLERGGPKSTPAPLPAAARVWFLDDWATESGSTIDRFMDITQDLGIPGDNITYATLCGYKLEDVRHIIGDPDRKLLRSAWDEEGGSSDCVGVRYDPLEPTVPQINRNRMADGVRSDLHLIVADYYRCWRIGNASRSLGATALYGVHL